MSRMQALKLGGVDVIDLRTDAGMLRYPVGRLCSAWKVKRKRLQGEMALVHMIEKRMLLTVTGDCAATALEMEMAGELEAIPEAGEPIETAEDLATLKAQLAADTPETLLDAPSPTRSTERSGRRQRCRSRSWTTWQRNWPSGRT